MIYSRSKEKSKRENVSRSADQVSSWRLHGSFFSHEIFSWLAHCCWLYALGILQLPQPTYALYTNKHSPWHTGQLACCLRQVTLYIFPLVFSILTLTNFPLRILSSDSSTVSPWLTSPTKKAVYFQSLFIHQFSSSRHREQMCHVLLLWTELW